MVLKLCNMNSIPSDRFVEKEVPGLQTSRAPGTEGGMELDSHSHGQCE